MFSDYLYDGSAFKPRQNQGPADHAHLLPFKQSGLCFRKYQCIASFKTELRAAVTGEGFGGPFLDFPPLLLSF